jgi:hypothetical protein
MDDSDAAAVVTAAAAAGATTEAQPAVAVAQPAPAQPTLPSVIETIQTNAKAVAAAIVDCVTNTRSIINHFGKSPADSKALRTLKTTKGSGIDEALAVDGGGIKKFSKTRSVTVLPKI